MDAATPTSRYGRTVLFQFVLCSIVYFCVGLVVGVVGVRDAIAAGAVPAHSLPTMDSGQAINFINSALVTIDDDENDDSSLLEINADLDVEEEEELVITTECKFFNGVNPDPGKSQESQETCAPVADPGKRAHCYALWTNVSNVVTLSMKGCWLNDERCYNRRRCMETTPKSSPLSPTDATSTQSSLLQGASLMSEVEKSQNRKDEHYFCCCDGNNCNTEFSYEPVQSQQRTDPKPGGAGAGGAGGQALSPQEASAHQLRSTLLYSLVPLTVLVLLVSAAFYLYRSLWETSIEKAQTIKIVKQIMNNMSYYKR